MYSRFKDFSCLVEYNPIKMFTAILPHSKYLSVCMGSAIHIMIRHLFDETLTANYKFLCLWNFKLYFSCKETMPRAWELSKTCCKFFCCFFHSRVVSTPLGPTKIRPMCGCKCLENAQIQLRVGIFRATSVLQIGTITKPLINRCFHYRHSS